MLGRFFHNQSCLILGETASPEVGRISGDELPVMGLTKLQLDTTGQECPLWVVWTERLLEPSFGASFLQDVSRTGRWEFLGVGPYRGQGASFSGHS